MKIPWTPEEEEVYTWEEIKESYKDFFKEMEKYDQEESRTEEQETKQRAV